METVERTMSWAYADSGDARLDRQHESLIHLTEALNEVIGGRGGRELGTLLCDFLGKRLERHFRTEEASVQDKADMAGFNILHDSHQQILKLFAAVRSSIATDATAERARHFNAFRLAMACHDRQIDGPLFQRLGTGGHLHTPMVGESASRIPLYINAPRDERHRLTDGIPIHDG